jgi:hypothetical protein
VTLIGFDSSYFSSIFKPPLYLIPLYGFTAFYIYGLAYS